MVERESLGRERERQRERLPAHHGHVVDGAVHGERADAPRRLVASFRVERGAGQAAEKVLAHLDLVVHHGGTGNLLGALRHGLPAAREAHERDPRGIDSRVGGEFDSFEDDPGVGHVHHGAHVDHHV